MTRPARSALASIDHILRTSPVLPVLTIERLQDALPLAQALVTGGLRVLEVTLRSACALEALTAIRSSVPEAIVGAGTITRPEDFELCRAAGAQFAVTPGLSSELIETAARWPLPLLPGVMTPSELIVARTAGFRACKLFPAAQAGGIGMLKALAGPFPDQLFCPTGGITRANAADYLALPNVACVGGSWVAPAEAIRAGDWVHIEALARDAAALAGS